jgi:alkanesulfonate monooxygenase SsuD/methylene tetrahydromethanopterin reductase-like flavin-dependent oxidoreductase (luciferase family)
MEQVLGEGPRLSPIEVMTYAAACNQRLRLGCAVFVTPVHSPVHLAKSLSSLDQLSRGRLEVGVATGGPNRPFAAFGVEADGYVTRFSEGLALMKACWTQPRIEFEGRFWQLHDLAMEPKPFQKPHPPIWFGGGHPAALRRAVRHGDAFMGAGSTTTAAFADQVTVVRAELAEAARQSFPIAKRVYITVDDDVARARERVAAGLERIYGDFGRRLTGVAVSGTPKDCVDGLRDVANAGAEMIVLNPVDDESKQMERLAGDVIPNMAI